MCSSFKQSPSNKDLMENLQLLAGKSLPTGLRSHPPVFPTHNARVILDVGDGPTLEEFYWSLMLRSTKGYAASKYSTHNARSETMAASPLYGPPWRAGRRCVFPVIAFNEWRGVKGSKEKLDIWVKGADTTFIAGIWDATTEGAHSCTMLTCEPNDFMKPIHNRMPVVLEDWRAWLDPDLEPATAAKMLRPYRGQLEFAPAG